MLHAALEFLTRLPAQTQLAITVACLAVAGMLAVWTVANLPAAARPRSRDVATEVERPAPQDAVHMPAMFSHAPEPAPLVVHKGVEDDADTDEWLALLTAPAGIAVAGVPDPGIVPAAAAEGADPLIAELDAIVSRFRRELHGWADRVTADYPWLLDSWEWQSLGLDWPDDFIGPHPDMVLLDAWAADLWREGEPCRSAWAADLWREGEPCRY